MTSHIIFDEIKNQKLLKCDEVIQFEQVLRIREWKHCTTVILCFFVFIFIFIQTNMYSYCNVLIKAEKFNYFVTKITSHGALQNWLFMNSRFSFETSCGFTLNAEVESTGLGISFFTFVCFNPLFLGSCFRKLDVVLLVRRGLWPFHTKIKVDFPFNNL